MNKYSYEYKVLTRRNEEQCEKTINGSFFTREICARVSLAQTHYAQTEAQK